MLFLIETITLNATWFVIVVYTGGQHAVLLFTTFHFLSPAAVDICFEPYKASQLYRI